MTTTNNAYDWETVGYRVIPEWSAYVMSAELDVWSLPRQARCKGGKTRQTPAKKLALDDGRVRLSQDGKIGRFHVRNELYPLVFPDLVGRPQAWCRNRHILTDTRPDLPAAFARHIGKPKVAVWGTGNRICLRCSQPPETFPDDNAYSLHYGIAGMSEYTNTRAQPKPRANDFSELDWDDAGFIISDRPRYSMDPFPQVD
jgi:hypothetical protein